MNTVLPLALVVLLTPALRGCDPGTPSTSDPVEPGISYPEVDLGCDGRASDPVAITASEVDGDTITLTVEYSGGCGEHDFALCWDGSWIKTLPMKVGLTLSHDANGDMCRAMISEDITFDLAPVADETLYAYPSTEGVYVLVGDDQHWYGF